MAKGLTGALFLSIEIFGAALGKGLGDMYRACEARWMSSERVEAVGVVEGAASYARRAPKRLGESHVAYHREFPEYVPVALAGVSNPREM